MHVLNAADTARALPWPALEAAIAQTLADAVAGTAHTPPRMVLPVAPGTHWFVMPSWLAAPTDLAAIKLITFSTGNAARGLPAILGDVLVLRASTGQRLALLDGPTVTARRTAALTVLAARRLAANLSGPLLLIGTGVQAEHHALALAASLPLRGLWVRGRTAQRSLAFAAHLRSLGLAAEAVAGSARAIDPGGDDSASDASADPALAEALAGCPLVVTATTAQTVCLRGRLRDDAFVAAIGAFTPQMIELAPALSRHIAAAGRIVLDSADARHEAGDLLAAGIATAQLPTLSDVLHGASAPAGNRAATPVLFKSCGSALWDLAAARCAVAALGA